MKIIEGERLEILSRKLEIQKGIFHAKTDTINDRYDKDLTERK